MYEYEKPITEDKFEKHMRALKEAQDQGPDTLRKALSEIEEGLRKILVQKGFSRAVKMGDEEAVKVYLEFGAHPNTYAKEKELPPLMNAILRRDTKMAQLLLDAGADPDVRIGYQEKPLIHLAYEEGAYEVARMLIRVSKDPMAKNLAGETTAHVAAFYGDVEGLEELRNRGHDLNTKSRVGEATPVRYAAWRDNVGTLAFLIDGVGIKPTLQDIGAALVSGATSAAAFMVQKGGFGPKDFMDEKGLEVIKTAIQNEDKAFLKFLHDIGLDMKGEVAKAAYNEALLYNRPEMITFITTLGGDPKEVRFPGGLNLLHMASVLSSPGVVKELLRQGLDPDQADNYGNTAAHHAAQRGHLDTAIRLLQELASAGANPVAKNNEGKTSADLIPSEDSRFKDVLLDLAKMGYLPSHPNRLKALYEADPSVLGNALVHLQTHYAQNHKVQAFVREVEGKMEAIRGLSSGSGMDFER